MRILQVIPYFYPAYAFGGPSKLAYQIARELAKRKHEVTVFTSDARDFESRLRVDSPKVVDGVRVYYFKNLAMTFVKNSKLFITPRLISIAKGEVEKFDVIHLHEYRSFQNVVLHYYTRKFGVPYVLQAHGSLPMILTKQKLKFVYDFFFGYKMLRDSSKVIALNWTESQQYKGMGVPKNKIEIIPNGVDLLEYANLPPKGSFKNKFNIPMKKRIILYLGRIHKVKGIDFLVKAYDHLVKTGRYDGVILVIAGPDDGYLREVKSLINTHGLNNKALLVGPLYDRDKLEAYVDADVVVLPSRYETFPIVILEAYACSKPVIASKIEFLGDLIAHGRTGFLFERGNIDELAHYLKNILDNRSDAKRMGAEGRKLVENRFSIDMVISRLELLYREAVDKASGTQRTIK